ncbi:site-specific integrase [Clostridium estertheticum]|uniref:site-specific integrase n=1 Tax=Clostridium estertheticum TaxID=238834 RepID=UPI001C7D10D1|nr:site-specific integrase [Clostridium estertheticum]MBX4266602.1 site-specific integrase [Clostridium estertheticum]WLC88060.1 site-specific integrase [Clostridium estertheticum]
MQYNILYREKDKGIQFIISYKFNGKWKQKSKQGFKSKKEAIAAADKALDILKLNSKSNITTDYEYITFKDFVDMYFKHLTLYKEANTMLLYEMSIKHFKSLYAFKLKEINTLDVQSCIDEMTQNKLKYSTIDTYVARIKVIFNAAIDQYKIISNSPIDNVIIKTSKEQSNKRALTQMEFNRLIANTKNPKYKLMFLLAGTCGLRVGEILGLTWDSIDFKGSTVNITKQWKNISSITTGFGELKSKNSYRTVPVPLETLNALQEFYKSNSNDINNRIIVYKNIQGLSQLLKSYFKKCGFDNLTIHELRHTYATMLISNGIDFKTAAKLLGHDIQQTMRIYAHVTDDMMDRATEVINKIF